MRPDLNEPGASCGDHSFSCFAKTHYLTNTAAPILCTKLRPIKSCAFNCGVKRNDGFAWNDFSSDIEQGRSDWLHLRAVKRHIPLNDGKQSSARGKLFGRFLNCQRYSGKDS